MTKLYRIVFRNEEIFLLLRQIHAARLPIAPLSTNIKSRQKGMTRQDTKDRIFKKDTEIEWLPDKYGINQYRSFKQFVQPASVGESTISVGTTQSKNCKLGNDDFETNFKLQESVDIRNSFSIANMTNTENKDYLQEITICLRDIDSVVTLTKKPYMQNVTQPVYSELPVSTDDSLLQNPINFSNLSRHYTRLAKFRLSAMVVITAAAGYGIAPGVLDMSTLCCCALGTGLVSASANTINQIFEVPYDSQMNRTKNRPLVQGHVSPLHAALFAGATCTVGTGMLMFGANPLTAGLGLFNLVLYTSVYTPMKRLSIANTWVGAVVGAVPPLMGWAACTGTLEPGAFVLSAILYAWQFPHFNSLSWNLRPDYSRAGYRMTSVINPDLCRRTALRHSLGIVAICSIAPLLDVTSWTFAAGSLPINLYVTYLSWKFYKQADSHTSRKLFRSSLLHVPLLVLLMLVCKKQRDKNSKNLLPAHKS